MESNTIIKLQELLLATWGVHRFGVEKKSSICECLSRFLQREQLFFGKIQKFKQLQTASQKKMSRTDTSVSAETSTVGNITIEGVFFPKKYIMGSL